MIFLSVVLMILALCFGIISDCDGSKLKAFICIALGTLAAYILILNI